MFIRNYIGLDVSPSCLRGVCVRRKGRGVSLRGNRVQALEDGILGSSVREPNIRDPKRFVEAVVETLRPLAGPEDRISLCLPDAIGRILLTEVETAFKTPDEGVEILKWQLKASLPAEAKNVRLDYQVIEKTETGRYRLAVSLIVKDVLDQYEELLAEAGFHAAVVDFHSMNLYNYYRSRIEMGEDFILVGLEGGILSLQMFEGKLPTFHRSARVEADPGFVFQEVNLSFSNAIAKHPGFRRAAVFLHCDWAEQESLNEALKSAFDRDIVRLDPHFERLTADLAGLDRHEARALAASVGAAERMILR